MIQLIHFQDVLTEKILFIGEYPNGLMIEKPVLIKITSLMSIYLLLTNILVESLLRINLANKE